MDENLARCVKDALSKKPRSVSEAAKLAGIPYTTFVRYAKKLNLYQQARGHINTVIETAVRSAIAQSPTSMLRAAKIANIPFSTFIRYAKQLGVYEPNQSGQGQRKFRATPNNRETPLEEILVGKHPHYRNDHLKRRLLAAGLKENICEECGLGTTWNGKPLILTLDHVDGDSTNHRLENLRMLCPNCHSQTETFCGRNADHDGSKHVSDEEFVQALQDASNICSALKYLGLADSETWYRRARRLIAEHNITHLIKGTSTNLTIQHQYTSPEECDRIMREKYLLEQQPYVRAVLASGIDFSKDGWTTAVAPLVQQEPQMVTEWMQTVMPEFYRARCFKRKPTRTSEPV
jgi:hypothetical protein